MFCLAVLFSFFSFKFSRSHGKERRWKYEKNKSIVTHGKVGNRGLASIATPA